MLRKVYILLLILQLVLVVKSFVVPERDTEINDAEEKMHPAPQHDFEPRQKEIEDPQYWVNDAQERLQSLLKRKQIEAQAKNIIFFLGDGMSVPTIAASRIYKGQFVDNATFGEESVLHIDTFPFTGTSKTFCADAQVADSACSATAYLCGTKANDGTIGVNSNLRRRNCDDQANTDNHVTSALQWAQAAGKSTGVVTTTRITHASPAANYAHIADRDWESDYKIKEHGEDSEKCDDIAEQLILRKPGKNINVIMGGGRREFRDSSMLDEERNATGHEVFGRRLDGKDLIEDWKSSKNETSFKYVTTLDDLKEVNTETTDFLLGLFEHDHIGYFDQREEKSDPTLADMVDVAIKILSKNPNGFFLFVEGGRIDHAHHDNLVQRALRETVEFDRAIKLGDDSTNDEDTLIVVTSDHAHAMHFAGYPIRGNPILRYDTEPSIDYPILDGKFYNTLGYANGPGQPSHTHDENGTCERHDIIDDDFESVTYTPPVPVPMTSETHGGDDVLIFAKGPYAHLFTGVQQQSYIPHVIGFAACIGEGAKHCERTDLGNDAQGLYVSKIVIASFIIRVIYGSVFN